MTDQTKTAQDALLTMLKEDGKVVLYRPRLSRMVGTTSAILLQQMYYRYNGKPFYKLKAPCSSRLYTVGDSWCEELGFLPGEFDTALRRISTKCTKGKNKTELLDKCPGIPQPISTETKKQYMKRLADVLKYLIIFWTDSDHVTWYSLNRDLFAKLLIAIYIDKLDCAIHGLNGESQFIFIIDSKNTNKEKDSVATKSSGDAVAADECIIHDDCLHYDNGCKMAQTGFKLLGDCNGCNAYHKRPDVDNGDVIQGIELGDDGRLTEESWKLLDDTTDSQWLEQHAVEDVDNDGTPWHKAVATKELQCEGGCNGMIPIDGNYYHYGGWKSVRPHCPGCWLKRDDTPPALTAEQAAVLEFLATLDGACDTDTLRKLEHDNSLNIPLLRELRTMGYMTFGDEPYAQGRSKLWNITPTGRAALEAWQANQPPPMADVMRACMPKPANVSASQQTEVDEPPPEPKTKKKRKAKTPCAKCESKTRKIVEDGKCWECCGYPDRAKMIEIIYDVLGWPKTKTMYGKKNISFMTRLAQWGATLEKLTDYAHWMKQYYDDKNWTLPFGSFNKEDMWHIFNASDNDDDDGLPYGNAPLFADPIPTDPAIVAEAAALSKEEVAALEIKVRKQITGQ